MVELYFKIKILSKIFGVLFVILCIVGIIIWIIVASHIEAKKKSYLESIGFEYKLRGVSSTGGPDRYWYVRESTCERIYDYEVNDMKLKTLKNKYKKI